MINSVIIRIIFFVFFIVIILSVIWNADLNKVWGFYSNIDYWLFFLGAANIVVIAILHCRFRRACIRDGVSAEDFTFLRGGYVLFRNWRNERLFAHYGVFLRGLCLLAIANIVIFYIIRPLI